MRMIRIMLRIIRRSIKVVSSNLVGETNRMREPEELVGSPVAPETRLKYI